MAKKIYNRQFRIKIPDSMVRLKDTSDLNYGDLYVDTVSHVIFILSALDSKFTSVKDYLDCSDKEIEDNLKKDYGDTSFRLLGCSRSMYYPGKTILLHFRVAPVSIEYDTYMMYFIHHGSVDIQFTFVYKRIMDATCQAYINAIMKTLKLK